MTNKPKVQLTERDQSTKSLDDKMRDAWDQMFEGEDREFTGNMFNALDHCPPYRPGAPVMVLSTPTSPNKSIFSRQFRDAFPDHFVIDEAHIKHQPLRMHEHQRQAMEWFQSQPHLIGHLDAHGCVSFDFESRQPGIGYMPLITRPRHSIGFGGHMDSFEYPSIGGQFKFLHDSVFIEDEYVAPPKKAKDWDSKADFWYRSAMGGKHMTNLAIAAYRAMKKGIYNPEFNWQDQYEARRKLHYIKHINVGTVGHIDWGNNRMKRARPYFPGYLADCIREAIKGFK